MACLHGARGAAAVAALDTADVRHFLQEVVPVEMQKAHIEGVAIVVQQSGTVDVSLGFGRRRPDQPEDIDAQRSVFRAASLSKPVTAVLVLQLLEEGKVDLDRDVNEYLDFRVEWREGRPVTLRDILMQASGFSDTYRLIFAVDRRDFVPLADYVRTRLPPLLFTPGTQPAYSNYGFGLAGYIVQRLRHQPFAVVARERIFEPLGMSTATFEQPAPGNIASATVQGYREGGVQPGPAEYASPESAGGLAVSAVDYARFVRALMNGGELDGHRILRSETVDQMLTLQPGPEGASRSLFGMGLGVAIDRIGGMTKFLHSGDSVQWHSAFCAYRDRDLVVVIMQNTEARRIWRPILRKFEERYGLTPPTMAAAPDAAEDRRVAGTYGPARYSGHSFLRIARLMQVLEVKPLEQGGILMGGSPAPLLRVGPGLYQDASDTDRVAVFYHEGEGPVSGVRIEPYQTMTRIGSVERPALIFGILGAGVAVAIITLAVMVVWAVRAYRQAASIPPMWVAGGLAALLLLACIGGWAATLIGIRGDLYSLVPARDIWIRAFEFAGLASAALLLIFLKRLAVRWSIAGRLERASAVVFAGALALTLIVLLDYKVLTSTLNY